MNLFLLFAGFITLLISGDLLVRGGVAIATRFKVSKLVIGMTLVSFGTSAPELMVSLQSVLSGHSDVSTGTVVGSNMSNIGFILGFTILLRPLWVNVTTIKIDGPVMLTATLMFILFILDGSLDHWEGILFVLLLLGYILFSIRYSRAHPEVHVKVRDLKRNMPVWLSILLVLISIAGLRFGADWLVTGATEIARNIGVTEYVISITVLAIGTSLPELSTSLVAAIKKEGDISIGNIVGSNLFNLWGILGITAAIKSIPVNDQILRSDIFWLAGISSLLYLFMITFKSGHLTRIKGLILMIIYVAYIVNVLI